jgi:hypothetical protein
MRCDADLWARAGMGPALPGLSWIFGIIRYARRIAMVAQVNWGHSYDDKA